VGVPNEPQTPRKRHGTPLSRYRLKIRLGTWPAMKLLRQLLWNAHQHVHVEPHGYFFAGFAVFDDIGNAGPLPVNEPDGIVPPRWLRVTYFPNFPRHLPRPEQPKMMFQNSHTICYGHRVKIVPLRNNEGDMNSMLT
jgi:hypothetical protein